MGFDLARHECYHNVAVIHLSLEGGSPIQDRSYNRNFLQNAGQSELAKSATSNHRGETISRFRQFHAMARSHGKCENMLYPRELFARNERNLFRPTHDDKVRAIAFRHPA